MASVNMKCQKCGTEWQVEQPAPEVINAGTVSMLVLPVKTAVCPGLECGEQYRSILKGAQFQVGYVAVPPEQRRKAIVIPHGNVLGRLAASRGNGR